MSRDRRNFYLGGEGLFERKNTVQVSGNRLIDRYVSYPKLDYLDAGKCIRKSGVRKSDSLSNVWRDRSLTDIGMGLKGYSEDELEECLSDEICALSRTDDNTEAAAELYDFGRADKTKYPVLYSEMIGKFGPSRDTEKIYPRVYPSNAFIGDYLRLELLMSEKRYDDVIKDCKNYFLGMVRTTGTLWEHNSPSASLDHGFASVVAEYIYICCREKAY